MTLEKESTLSLRPAVLKGSLSRRQCRGYLVLDANVLVYACGGQRVPWGEPEVTQRERCGNTQVVVYELVRVFADLTREPSFVLVKLRELSEMMLCASCFTLCRED